jgi:hypothetical protein
MLARHEFGIDALGLDGCRHTGGMVEVSDPRRDL